MMEAAEYHRDVFMGLSCDCKQIMEDLNASVVDVCRRQAVRS